MRQEASFARTLVGSCRRLQDSAALDGQTIALRVPDLASQWREIEVRIAPFRSTRRWKAKPEWKTPVQLQFIMTGSAHKNGGATESDFLDFVFRVTLNFNASGEGQVTGLEDAE